MVANTAKRQEQPNDPPLSDAKHKEKRYYRAKRTKHPSGRSGDAVAGVQVISKEIAAKGGANDELPPMKGLNSRYFSQNSDFS